MSNPKIAREKDEGHASAINVVLTTLKSTPVSTSSENGIRFQTSPLSLVGGGGTQKQQNICCNRSFPSRNSYLLHLLEKAPKDVVHEMTLIEMGMLRCSVCSTWVHRDNMSLHLKKSHGVVKVTKNAQVVAPLSKHPASKNVSSETPLKTGKSYVIKVSGKTLPTGNSFVVSCPSNKLTSNIDATSVTSKPPMKLITTTSGNLYSKIHLQRGNNISAGNVVVRQSLPNTSLPMVSFGSRVIMKSSMKVSDVKNGVPVATSSIQKLVQVAKNSMLQEGEKAVNGVTTLQIDGSTMMASSSSGNFVNINSTPTSSKEKEMLKPNQKSFSKSNKVVSSSYANLVSSKHYKCESSIHNNTELDSSTKETSGERNKSTFNKKNANNAKLAALQLSFSEISENYVGKAKDAVADRSNSHREKVKPKGKGNVTYSKVKVGYKPSLANGNKVKSDNQKAVLVKEQPLNDSISRDEHLVHVNRSLILSDEKSESRRETEGVKPTAGKKQRKQILKPVLEPEGDPKMDVPITSKVKVRKKKKEEFLSKEPDTTAFAKGNIMSPTTNQRKCGKSLKENKGDTCRPTPKTSHVSGRGGRGGLKKRGPGRPRKEEVVKPATPDSYEINSLFPDADHEDIENEPYLISRVREDDNVPTVELDLFTLPSLNEQISVFLTDPHNPDFKVYASMDAIFVGDSALGDVTNQIGYVTDGNNVVFVNPGHFLFPNIQEIDKFVPSPILTMKEKIGHSPKKLCKLSSSINHNKVICLDKRLMNADESNRKKSRKCKALLENQESPQKGKNCSAYSTKETVVKTPEKSRVRRRSARLSGEQDDAPQVPLKLKKGDLVSKDKKPFRGALGNKLASKKLPLKMKINSARLGKDHNTSESVESEDTLRSAARELKVIISPLKLEHQSLVEELLENRKLPVKPRLALKFNDYTVNKCMEARRKLGAQIFSEDILSCDTPVTSAVCEEKTMCARRQRTRTRSADSAYSETSTGLDPVASGKCNDNYLSRRKGRLKSESEVLTNRKKSKSSDSARDQRWSRQNCEDASSLLKTRLRHFSNVRSLPETTKTSSDFPCKNPDSDDDKHINHKEHDSSGEYTEHTQTSEAVAEKTTESGVKESLETLPENSLIKGKNWNITDKSSKSLHRTRPVRERRPSSKWLESLAYGGQFRKVPSPMSRTARSISDTTAQVDCENLENKLGDDENGILSISELKQSNLNDKHDYGEESALGESETKETASFISNETGVEQGAVESKCDKEKENITKENQSIASEVISDLSPKKLNHIAKNSDSEIPSEPSGKKLDVSCESTNHVPIDQKGTCTSEPSDNMYIVSAEQTASEEIIESNKVKSINEILNVDGVGESIKSSKDEESSSVTDKEFQVNQVSINIKKKILKKRRTKLILKKVEENFDDILKKTGSASDMVESLSKNRSQTMSNNLSVDVKSPDVCGMDFPVVSCGFKEDEINSENITALGTKHVNIECESNEGEVESKLEALDVKQEDEKETGRDYHKTISKSREIELQDYETRSAKATLSENMDDTANCNVVKAIEDANEIEKDSSNKLKIMKVVDDQKLTKAILNKTPRDTLKSDWSGLLVTTAEGCTSKLLDISVKALEGKSESPDEVKLGNPDGNPVIDNSSANIELKSGKESSPLKSSFSRVSALLIEVSESLKAEEKDTSPRKFEGPRSPKKSSSSPTKGGLDISPPREWLGRGAKLRAQVLIQDQQTGVTDSHIVSPSHTYSPEKEKSSSKSDKLIISTSDTSVNAKASEWLIRGAKLKAQVLIQDQQMGVTDSHVVAPSHTYSPENEKYSSPKSEKLIISSSDTSVNSKASGGSSKIVKSPKSPRICCEEREWQARGAKLKAQVMITDQQTGHTNTRVETFESPRSSLTSPHPKKMKFESPPGSMKDIRTFFTLCKSPERGITKSDDKSSLLSSPPTPGQHFSPGSSSASKADRLNNSSFTNCSPKSVSSSPRPSPQNSKRKKVKLYKVTSNDIRNFLTPTSGTKRKVESDAVLDVSKSVKRENDVFPAIKTEMEDDEWCQSLPELCKTSKSPKSSPVGAKNIHPLQKICSMTPDIEDTRPLQENCKMKKTSDFCESVPKIPSVEFDFEGFKLSSRSSELRAKSLVRIVSHLENNALNGLGKFPLPVDHLCDWSDDWLNIKIFDKHLDGGVDT